MVVGMDCRVYAATGDPWLMVGDGGSGGGGGGDKCWMVHLVMKVNMIWQQWLVTSWKMEVVAVAILGVAAIAIPGFVNLLTLPTRFRTTNFPRINMVWTCCRWSILILSINSMDLEFVRCGSCKASCIRFSLVKLLSFSGYDAAVCISRWQGTGKVPGGDHEYIDVINYNGSGNSDHLIIEIDFKSHFEIARAVPSYSRILKLLPVVYVGSLPKLKQFLQVMVEAAKSSLKQNSMPLPPWRSLAYLQSKWHSPYQRQTHYEIEMVPYSFVSEQKLCAGHLNRLKTLIQFEMETDRNHLKKSSGRSKIDRWRLRTP